MPTGVTAVLIALATMALVAAALAGLVVALYRVPHDTQ
jgi:hypothetical protein